MYNTYKNSVRCNTVPGQDSLPIDPILILRPILTLYKEEYTKVKQQLSQECPPPLSCRGSVIVNLLRPSMSLKYTKEVFH